MQTNEPINTIPIQQFIQVVKTAEGSNQKEIRIPLTQAKALAYALGTVMANHQGRLEGCRSINCEASGLIHAYNTGSYVKHIRISIDYAISRGRSR